VLPAPSPVTLLWRWRQHGPLKCWYPTTTLHGITTQKTLSTWTTNIFYNKMIWPNTTHYHTVS
jgi:hypothetical protein